VAWNGSRYFVVWSNGFQLLGTFIAPDGPLATPRSFFGEPSVIGQRAPANFELAPDVAWDGRNFIIVFGEAPNIPCTLPAPRNVVSYFGGNTARIDWQQGDTPAGFVLEESIDFGTTWYWYNVLSGDARTINVIAHVGNLFRVRAFGPGGVSEGTITSIGSQQRRRASH
jgi:hypothetical protein